ncbi:MAG: hypothetical protein CL840_07630 [Crocinitomicaceae bacterium]|nr:hypothetical protein [Crocinitomicaceae bacterium]
MINSESYNLLLNLAKRNIKLKYKNSILGFFWSFLTPLVYLIIFYFVFSTAFASVENYALYVLTGLVYWQFFSNTTNQVIQSFISNAGIIKTINVPVISFPFSALISELGNLVLTFVPFLALMYYLGYSPGLAFFAIIPVTVLLAILSLGLSLFLGTLNVYLRDISILWNTLNPALFYLTPIAYTLDLVPEKFHWILKLNPLWYFFKGVRASLYSNTWPSIETWGYMVLISFLVFAIGWFTFKKLQPGIISNV